MSGQLLDLPEELLLGVLSCLHYTDLVACQASCRLMHRLCNQDLLWRKQCLTQYRYWSEKHELKRHLDEPALLCPWKKLFQARRATDLDVSAHLEKILAHQASRVQRVQHISRLGEDTKDVLLRQLTVPETKGDGLARKFWASEALASVERRCAVQVWQKLQAGQSVPLERALVAFDQFIAHPPPLSGDDVSLRLDEIASDFSKELAALPSASEPVTPREKALALARYLRENGLVGLRHQGTYRELQNTLIGVALTDDNHPSLPIISASIYACVARRVGLDAHPVGFHMHVIVIVRAEAGQTLEGKPMSQGQEAIEVMYLDPWNNAEEIEARQLISQLQMYGVPSIRFGDYLRPATTTELVVRVTRNIEATLDELRLSYDRSRFQSLQLRHDSADRGPRHGDRTVLKLSAAHYATAWTDLLLVNQYIPQPVARAVRRQALDHALRHLLRNFEPMFMNDLSLVEQIVVPLFSNGTERNFLEQLILEYYEDDRKPIKAKARNSTETSMVKHRVGTHFMHRAYNYTAVVIGWDAKCEADDEWILQMGIDRLEGGRHQCFYHVVVDDESRRYVAEENIVPLGAEGPRDEVDEALVQATKVAQTPKATLMRDAGRWFKRWEPSRGLFISNMMGRVS